MIEEADPDYVLGSDEEDQRMFQDLVQKTNQDIDEEFIPAEFSDTYSEEEQENIDMGHFENDDDYMPEMMYDRENPSLAEGVVLPSAVDCRNAVATLSIKHEVEFKIEKSDPSSNYKKAAEREASPMAIIKKRKLNTSTTPKEERCSVTGSNVDARVAACEEEVLPLVVPQIHVKLTRSRAREMTIPASNTRSKKAKSGK
ncbi:hypothetical protein D1007_00822 [Hordeum vulgare]|nr:hypothetical protein D1007_00822 [Hordeum vulgare]